MPSSVWVIGQWLRLQGSRGVFLGLASGLLGLLPVTAEACRLLPPPPELTEVLWVHVEGPCLPEEHEVLAVKGADILEALKQGKNVDLYGVLVVDTVMLDLLPLHEVSEQAGIPPVVRDRLQQRHITAAHIIPGSLSIRDSRFEKVLATNLERGALVIIGTVDFAGTVFQQSVDLSKTVFAGPLRFNTVRVDFEAFFIDAEFHQPGDFSDVIFGTHSRFHSAVFHDQVTFADARFAGVAEFLEVEFQRGANFSRAHFIGGTGFSGSVFAGPADFANATFKHEIYFRFTKFTQGVSFRQAQFHREVDFTKAEFIGDRDFSGVVFRTPPEFTGSNLSLEMISAEDWGRPQVQLGIFAGLVFLMVFYVLVSKWRKRT